MMQDNGFSRLKAHSRKPDWAEFCAALVWVAFAAPEGGYDAISSFQLAQFGHNYSAMFLATVATMSQSSSPEAFNLMMRIFSESWLHGSKAPA
jgi:hypothetical protein